MTTPHRLYRDERGMSLVFVGVGFMAFLAATTLAIDVGMFATARSQAQNSADSGALAGAIALYFDDYDDRSAGGPAKQNAMVAARENQVIGAQVSVTPPDVTFPLGPTGLNNRVKARVFRNDERGNPVGTLMGQYFGVTDVNIQAEATAEASQANAMTCVMPFTIPDKWTERQDPDWDVNDTFKMWDNHGNLMDPADVYHNATDKGRYTGYNPQRDKGTLLMIRAGTGNDINPSMYFSYSIGGVTGAAQYNWNIFNCNTTVMGFDDLLLMEPGNMVGPTVDGIDQLIAKDPDAYWDTTKNKPVSTRSPSPRVVAIPLYDPEYYDTGKKNGRYADLKVVNYLGFFITGRSGNNIYGRITPIAGMYKGNAGPAPAAAFPVVIRLVE